MDYVFAITAPDTISKYLMENLPMNRDAVYTAELYDFTGVSG